MSSRDLTIAGYMLLVMFGLGLQIRSYSPNSKIPSLGTVSSRVMRTKTGRIGVMAGWAWLGLHFFAR
jgi:hypothetical protein